MFAIRLRAYLRGKKHHIVIQTDDNTNSPERRHRNCRNSMSPRHWPKAVSIKFSQGLAIPWALGGTTCSRGHDTLQVGTNFWHYFYRLFYNLCCHLHR